MEAARAAEEAHTLQQLKADAMRRKRERGSSDKALRRAKAEREAQWRRADEKERLEVERARERLALQQVLGKKRRLPLSFTFLIRRRRRGLRRQSCARRPKLRKK